MTTASRSSIRLAPPLLVLLCALALAAPAQAYVYWTNYSGDTIGRALLDGGSVEQAFIGAPVPPVNPCGIDFDADYVYWANKAGSAPQGKIARAKLDGSEVDNNFITGLENPCGVAVNATHIYWGNEGTGGTTIGRANLDGTEDDNAFVTGLNRPGGLAVDDEYVYWAELSGKIGRAKLNGTEVDTSFIETGAQGIAIHGPHIYWANQLSDRIGRANLDGSGKIESFITGGNGSSAIAINRKHIYWSNEFGDTIGRANLDGSAVDQSFITGAADPTGVAVAEAPPDPLIPVSQPIPDATAELRLLRIVRNRKRGTAKLIVRVSGPGILRLAGNRKVKGATRKAKAAGKVKLPLIPKGKGKEQLLDRGRVKVLARVTFTPAGGEPLTKRWRRALVRVDPGLR